MKILEKIMYLVYILAFTLNIYLVIKTNDYNRLAVVIWIFNAGMMFHLYIQTDKFGDERVKWRDELVKKTIKCLGEAVKLNDEIIKTVGNDFVSKTVIAEIRDKAKEMDEYNLSNVINDLNIVLGEDENGSK